MFRFYNRLIQRYYYTTQIVTGGTLWCLGDIISQKGISYSRNEGEKALDKERMLRMTGFGLFVASPMYAFWYQRLEVITSRFIRPPWHIIITKAIVDATVFDPIYLSVFYLSSTLAERKSFKEAKEKLMHEFGFTYLVDISLWTPVQLANFRFVPVPFQALVVQSVNLFWNAFLSYTQHEHK
ncbi:hypothetical protein ROZALSC1DRAFT_17446 [Rozella allomycis CSF55]|uniref:Uncharacterized protein n=1 Tax=Rozella allomycis (strain CSF55) TaxID=988480 RepID=A0A4P9YC39_ROZAC|nr:hypothetical protein ROZALSC1DRAFT_17446 [Rozella allomycis CSF55]